MSELQEQRSNNPPVSFPTRFLATGFFAGYSPVIPGTAGSLVGLLLYALPGMENTLTLGAASLVMLLVGTFVSAKMEKRYGEDPSIVVIDEVVGMWISLLTLPKNLVVALMAFVWFRVYDTIKPSPARQLERLQHGWGIMLDDVAAGIYANVTVRIILLLFPRII
ncbi:MAG: phosphatidylglycerophosphatase A [Bacteroidota bacterium]|jgi:phosphatidylglycerophosphatase A